MLFREINLNPKRKYREIVYCILFLFFLVSTQMLLSGCGWMRVQITQDESASSSANTSGGGTGGEGGDNTPTNATITSVTSSNTNGAYTNGTTIDIEVLFSKAVTVTGGTPTLDLNSNINAQATYLSGSGTNTLTFRYTVNAADGSSDLEYVDLTSLHLNGATIQDAAGLTANLTLPIIGGGSSLSSLKDLYVDTVSPVTPPTSLNDGTWSNSLTQTPVITFTPAVDNESGITQYEVKIIDHTNADTEITAYTTFVSGNRISGLSLTNGNNYQFKIRAVDRAGNYSSEVTSDGWTLDTTLPTSPSSFIDGVMAFSPTGSDTPAFTWLAGSDAESGVKSYQLAIGDSLGATNIMDWTDVGNVLTRIFTGLTLQGSKRYYSIIKTIDNAENSSAVQNSDGWWNLALKKVAVDNTAPSARMFSTTATFGIAIAISEDGSTLVIGASGDDTNASGVYDIQDGGAAFVYIKSGGVWVLQQKLEATGTNAQITSDGFGSSVSISGDTIVIGASSQDYDENGANNLADAGAAYVFTRSAGVWSQQQKLVGVGTNARVASDHFGYSVAISGDTIAIGANSQDYDENGANTLADAGAVYVFTRTGTAWSQQQKLVGMGGNARVASDSFGISVSISGDTIVAGASAQDYDASGANVLAGAGAAYVFTRSAGVWSQQQKLVGSGVNGRVTGDSFGTSVSISGDTIVVGAVGQDYDENGANIISFAGAAYVFTRSAGVWSQQQKLVATGANARVMNDAFGWSVSINGDKIVVGSILQDYDESGANSVSGSGAAYVYLRTAGVWSQQQKLVGVGANARMASDGFGWSVSISGDTIVAGAISQGYNENGANFVSGAGAAYVYTASLGVWTQQQKLADSIIASSRSDLLSSRFGSSIAISEDGATMAVGAYNDSTDSNGENYLTYAGAVYVYIKSGGSWVLQQKLVGSGFNNRLAFDYFGTSVAISGDTIVVGAIGQDYDASGNNYIFQAGAVYVFTRTANVWTQQKKIIPSGVNARTTSFDEFGRSVSISGDTIVVGVSSQDYDASGASVLTDAGAAFVYTRTAGVWSQQQKLVATGVNSRANNDNFGSSVSISGDTIVVGAHAHDYDESGANLIASAGAAFVYTRTAGVWSQQQKLVGGGVNSRVTGDFFGESVSISGEMIVVGAYSQDYDQNGANLITDAGAAFVYTRTAGVWSQQQKLVGVGTNARVTSDNFGTSVAINGDTIVVGANTQDYNEIGANSVTNVGAAYVYTRNAGVWSQELKLVGNGTNGRQNNDSFGNEVAISENGTSDGYTIGIGAIQQDYTSTGTNPISDAGAVFVFY